MSEEKIDDIKYYTKLGFKCGLEIHQQLLTETKLFCRCKAVLHNDKPSSKILRHMRPTLSELGEYDGTALMEFKTKKNVTYQLYNDTVCTYEMDDTPPFKLNKQALDIALEISLLLNCNIVDEIHISRKQYLDGSIPTGFQRTGIVGIEGAIPFKNRKIRIIQLGLEEDACREVSDIGHNIIFKTDRLSIPLVEVVTYPDIKTPKEACEIAEYIGRLLRSTGKVRRGLGSIRQDVNVSIKGGTRVELKGVPKLQYISKAVAVEAERQKALLEIRDELRIRGITETNLHSEYQDLTPILKKTKCKVLKKVINQKGRIYGVVLRLFAGILDIPTQPNKTFADEISGRIRVIACLDKMPNIVYSGNFDKFGLTPEEVNEIKQIFDAKIPDTIILVWGNKNDVKTATEEIKIRAIEATKGVPSETRQIFEDGTNDFERILPGPDRMYPDTDSPPTPISESQLNKIKQKLTEPIWEREKRLKKLGLSDPLIKSLSISKNLVLFDKIVKELKIKPTIVAITLEEKIKYIKRKLKKEDIISDKKLYQLFKMFSEKNFSKEAISIIIEYIANNPQADIKYALKELDIKPMSKIELELEIKKIKKKYSNKKNSRPFKTIMGEVMKSVRYKIDGKVVKNLLEKELAP